MNEITQQPEAERQQQPAPAMKARGTRAEVWNGTARKTSGGLTKEDLIMNPRGVIVSKKQSDRAKLAYPAMKQLLARGMERAGERVALPILVPPPTEYKGIPLNFDRYEQYYEWMAEHTEFAGYINDSSELKDRVLLRPINEIALSTRNDADAQFLKQSITKHILHDTDGIVPTQLATSYTLFMVMFWRWMVKDRISATAFLERLPNAYAGRSITINQ